MIEVKAKFVRADSAIYASGERVECLIQFALHGNDSREENLAWASAQLHCYRKTNYNITSSDKVNELTELVGKTALDVGAQANGDILIATKPKILFCDLKLLPSEMKTYFFNEMLPRNGPPTYRGHDIKYFYRITIATQRVKSKVLMLSVPIRVLPIPIIVRPDEMQCTEETNDELAPTNPFLEKREISELEISWHHLKNATARRAPKYYRISNKRGFVGRFCLFKPSYKIGEDIVGSLDFSNCKVRCVQFSVKLQSQEISLQSNIDHLTNEFNDASSVNSLDLASIASGTAIDNLHKSKTSGSARNIDDEEPVGKISTLATIHQVCYSMLKTSVIIPIPLHITPSFRTDLIELRWRLHFEFVTSTLMDFGKPNPTEGELKAPAEIPVETMVWNLPIAAIYAANPLQIYSPSQTHSLLIK